MILVYANLTFLCYPTDSLSLQTPILLLLLSLKRDDSTIYLTGLTSYISFIFYTHDTLLTVFCSSHTSPDSYMHYLHKLLSLFHEATYLSAPNRAHSLQYILYYVSSHYYYPFLHVLSFQNSSCFLFSYCASQGHVPYLYSSYYSKQVVLLHLLSFTP